MTTASESSSTNPCESSSTWTAVAAKTKNVIAGNVLCHMFPVAQMKLHWETLELGVAGGLSLSRSKHSAASRWLLAWFLLLPTTLCPTVTPGPNSEYVTFSFLVHQIGAIMNIIMDIKNEIQWTRRSLYFHKVLVNDGLF